MPKRLRRLAAWLWAGPNTLLGGVLMLLAMLAWGASAPVLRRGVFEQVLPADAQADGRRRRWAARCLRHAPFAAITFGHVVLFNGAQAVRRWRGHERLHVRQYERWGPFFLPAYLASSAWERLRGRQAWRHNRFERPAVSRDLARRRR